MREHAASWHRQPAIADHPLGERPDHADGQQQAGGDGDPWPPTCGAEPAWSQRASRAHQLVFEIESGTHVGEERLQVAIGVALGGESGGTFRAASDVTIHSGDFVGR